MAADWIPCGCHRPPDLYNSAEVKALEPVSSWGDYEAATSAFVMSYKLITPPPFQPLERLTTRIAKLLATYKNYFVIWIITNCYSTDLGRRANESTKKIEKLSLIFQ